MTNVLGDFTANTNSFSQINTRNASNGANASSDIIATADTGTDTTNFIDLGINNSGFSTSTWTINSPLDGYLYTSDTNLSIGAASNKYVSIFTGGTLAANERLRVTGIGSVGIGTTNPSQTLHVQGNVRITGALYASDVSGISTSGTSGQVLQSVGTGISWVNVASVSISTNTTNQSQYLTYVTGTGSTTGFGITTSGLVFNPSTTRLGIGTTNARANLDVTDSILISTGVAQTAGFSIKSYTNSNGAISFEDVDNTNPRFSIDRDTCYLFKVNDSSFVTRLIVNNSGNLGVGTTNPTSKLTVVGNTLVSGNLGIGTTNARANLDVVGNAIITGISTVGLGNTSTPPNNSQMSFELTSNTNLRIKVRGTDGVLRSGNITLA